MMELEHEADLPVPDGGEGLRALLAEDEAVQPHGSGGRDVERPQQVEQRALARAARADDGHELPASHREIQARQDLDRRPVAAAIDLPKTLRLENRAHSWRIASTGVSPAAAREG